MNTETTESLLAHCSSLKGSAHFEWWLRRCVIEPMEEAERKRSDITATPDDRTYALVEYLALKRQADFIAETEETARRGIANQ